MSHGILDGPVEAGEIMGYLPHRYPLQLVDRVISMEMEPEKVLVGIKNVTANEPCFQGHFPGNPVFPGVLMIEAMAQAAGMLAHLAAVTEGRQGELYYLAKVDNAKFNRVVVPGDQLVMTVIQKRIFRGMGQYDCRATVDDRKVASCQLLCAGRKE